MEENSPNQSLIINFTSDLLYKEFKNCKIINITNDEESEEGDCIDINKKEKKCTFNLSNFLSGNYSLICENLCSDKNNITVTIKNKTCKEYQFRVVNDNKVSDCVYCENLTEGNESYFYNDDCITKDECKKHQNDGYALFYPDDKPENKRCIKCSDEGKERMGNYCDCDAGTIDLNGTCYLPDDKEIKDIILNKTFFCDELCNKRGIDCDRVWNNCSCSNKYYGIYCEYDINDDNIINSSLNHINNKTFITNKNKFDSSIVAKVKSIIN